MDALPEPPPQIEQVITQKLSDCGLRTSGFIVKYDNELQSYVVVIDKEADASVEHFDCIRQAVDYEIVSFDDPELQQAYQDKMFEALRPQMLADARAELEKHGILAGFPERSKFDSDKLFAEALEQHCGMIPGSFFIQSGSGIIGQWQAGDENQADDDKLSCLWAAMMYLAARGQSFNLGFIGNEAIAPEK